MERNTERCCSLSCLGFAVAVVSNSIPLGTTDNEDDELGNVDKAKLPPEEVGGCAGLILGVMVVVGGKCFARAFIVEESCGVDLEHDAVVEDVCAIC